MTAITINTPRIRLPHGERVYAVASNTKIVAGAIVALLSTGYATNATSTLGNSVVVGIATDQADNTGGAAGAINVTVDCDTVVYLPNSGTNACTIATRHCYVEDNNTVSASNNGGLAPAVGQVLGVSSLGVAVYLPAARMPSGWQLAPLAPELNATTTVINNGRVTILRSCAAGGPAGTADDVTILTSLPFKMRMLYGTGIVVKTAVAASTCTIRSAISGGGTAYSNNMSVATAGAVANTFSTAGLPSLAAGSAIYLYRSDRSAVLDLQIEGVLES